MANFFRPLILTSAIAGMAIPWSLSAPKPASTWSALPVSNAEAESTFRLDQPMWAEQVPRNDRIDVDLPGASAGKMVLMVSSHQSPRQATEFTVSVEDSTAPRGVSVDWHAVESVRCRPGYPPLPPGPSTPMPCGEEQYGPVSGRNVRRVWFLPGLQTASASEGGPACTTITPLLTAGRVCLLLDETLECSAARRGWARRIAARLNDVLIPRVESVFGPVADRLADGTLTVVVTSRVRHIGGTDATVKACVLSTDYRVDLDFPNSHACDVIYIDPELSPEGSDAILVHELTHAAQFCAFRRQFGATPWPLSDWMIEGTAHAAEVLLTQQIDNVAERLSMFHQVPEKSPLVVTDAVRSRRWRDPYCRGAACSFFTWAGQRYGLNSLSQVAITRTEGRDPWKTVSGHFWPELHRSWLISLALANEVRHHPLVEGKPLKLTIDGEATAWFTLPKGTGASIRLVATCETPIAWQATLLFIPDARLTAGASGPAHCSVASALASPVTIFR